MVPNQRSFLPPSTVPLPHFNSLSLSHTLPSAAPPRRPPLHHALPEATSALPGNYCQPKCAEPWVEVKFEDEKQGKVQVVASPLIHLTNKPNATIEDIGSPEKVIASLGPFVTGNTYDPDELLETSVEKLGDQTPRILMAMARDGLLPPFFSDINELSQVPVKSTIFTGIVAAVLAFTMEVSQLAGMEPIISVSTGYGWSSLHSNEKDTEANVGTSGKQKPLVVEEDVSIDYPLISNHLASGNYLHEGNRRRVVGWVIALTCFGVFVLTYAASDLTLLRLSQGCRILTKTMLTQL